MGRIEPFKPLVLFIGGLISNVNQLPSLAATLKKQFGPIKLTSDSYPYTHSTYYQNEMGETLLKVFFVFSTLISPEGLPAIKQKTNAIESSFTVNEKRTINLDPGALSLHNIMLLSTKNFYHRIPLSDGIYAELTLTYSKNSYHELPWTYPDFKFKTYQEFFLKVRKVFHDQLR
jgi:hypothetical protein